MIHLRDMYRIIRYLLATKCHGLRFLPHWHQMWEFVAYSDGDYASEGNKEKGPCILCILCGVPIAWRSKGMRSGVLSTTEAVYIALSEVVKELKFIIQFLETMKIQIGILDTVCVGNVGAIQLSTTKLQVKEQNMLTTDLHL